MNRLIRIGILWCLAISIASAQEADTSKDESNQRNPGEPQASAGTPSANSKAVVATTMAAETELPANSPIRVTLRMRKDESYEKIEQLIEALKDAGVKQMSFSWEGASTEGEEERNTLILHLPQGFTLGELQKIESAANAKAMQCGLRLFIVTQNAAQPAGEFFGPADPQPPQPVEPKRITVFPTGDAQESEVAMKFIAYLENEGFATGKVTELILTPDSPLRVDFIMRHDESHEKVKEFLTSLGDAGVERIFFETDENVVGGDEKNYLSFRAVPGYSPVEVERIENSAISAAESCGLALSLGGTYVKSWNPNGESATVPSLRPVQLKPIALFANVDEEPPERVTRFLTDLERDGIAKVEAKVSAPTSKYPIQLNLSTMEDEPLEKIRLFIVALRQSGVEQITCDFGRIHSSSNSLLFTAIPGYSHEEQQWIENAARTAAEHCGLSVALTGTMVFSSNANARKIAQLRTDYEAANKQAHDLAESLRQTPDAAKKSELRAAVKRAFTLRQSLLRAELQEMQARLEKTQQSLDMRDRMADQIVDRRVEDLLNPDLDWNDSELPKKPTSESVAAAAATTSTKDSQSDVGMGSRFAAEPGEPSPEDSAARKRDAKTDVKQFNTLLSYDDLELLKILNMDPVPANAVEHFPDWLKELNGKTVRIRGFMYPTFESSGLKEFTLARDNGICTFVCNPKIYEVIGVTLDEGVTTDYITGRPFYVEGTFHIEPKSDEDGLARLFRISDSRILPVAADEMDPHTEDLSNAQLNEVNDHPIQITGPNISAANAKAKPEIARPVTELEGDWHRVAYIDKWQTERRPINLTIRANQETSTLWTGESYSRMVVIDQNAKTIEVGANELKGGLPNQVVSERGTYTLSGDLLTIHSEYTISDAVNGSVIQKGQHTNIWRRGLCKIENYDSRNPGHGMGICHVNGSDENTGLGKLLPGDKVDVLVSFASKEGPPVQRVLVEKLEVDGSSEPKESGQGERQIRLLGTREQSLIIDDANMRGVTLIVSRKLDGKTHQFPGGINADAVEEMKEVAPRKSLDVSEPTPFP